MARISTFAALAGCPAVAFGMAAIVPDVAKPVGFTKPEPESTCSTIAESASEIWFFAVQTNLPTQSAAVVGVPIESDKSAGKRGAKGEAQLQKTPGREARGDGLRRSRSTRTSGRRGGCQRRAKDLTTPPRGKSMTLKIEEEGGIWKLKVNKPEKHRVNFSGS